MVSHIEQFRGISTLTRRAKYETARIVQPGEIELKKNYIDVEPGENPFYQIVGCNASDTETYVGVTTFENVTRLAPLNNEERYAINNPKLVVIDHVLKLNESAVIDIQESTDSKPLQYRITHT